MIPWQSPPMLHHHKSLSWFSSPSDNHHSPFVTINTSSAASAIGAKDQVCIKGLPLCYPFTYSLISIEAFVIFAPCTRHGMRCSDAKKSLAGLDSVPIDRRLKPNGCQPRTVLADAARQSRERSVWLQIFCANVCDQSSCCNLQSWGHEVKLKHSWKVWSLVLRVYGVLQRRQTPYHLLRPNHPLMHHWPCLMHEASIQSSPLLRIGEGRGRPMSQGIQYPLNNQQLAITQPSSFRFSVNH